MNNFMREKREAEHRSYMLGCCLLLVIVIITLLLARVAAAENRGFMIGTFYPDADGIKDTVKQAYVEYGANTIRYQVVDPETEFTPENVAAYSVWWEDKIAEVLEVAAFIHEKQYPIRIILDMHTTPGGVQKKSFGSQHWVLTEEGAGVWAQLWMLAIDRIEQSPYSYVIIAYEPVNEPAAKGTKGLWKKYRELFDQLRPLTQKPFIVSHDRSDIEWYETADSFPEKYDPVWYTTHHYKPHGICLYKVWDHFNDALYEKTKRKFYQNTRQKIRNWLRPARKFQNKYGVRMFIGEFGCSKEAEDVHRSYVFDETLRQLNAWEFDWTIHALNEHPVWQPEGNSKEVIRQRIMQ